MEERRKASRVSLPPGFEASVSGVTVRLVDLSLIGARLEHSQRFPLQAAQLTLVWKGAVACVPFRVVRSEIVGQRAGDLIYYSGIQFGAHDANADGLIAAVLRWAEHPPVEQNAVRPAVPIEPVRSLDDTWTRQVRFLREEPEETDIRFARFRLTAVGWIREVVASPQQPADGFTIRRDRADFAELQRTYERADEDTRRMMRIALESQLG